MENVCSGDDGGDNAYTMVLHLIIYGGHNRDML